MTEEVPNLKSRVYQWAISAAGISVWLLAVLIASATFQLREQLIIFSLIPLTVVIGMYPNNFPLPWGLRFTSEKISFTFTDAIIILVASKYGPAAAVVVAGAEGYFASRRVVRRVSSNLFSFGMMSLTAAVAAIALHGMMSLDPSQFFSTHKSGVFLKVAVSILIASVIYMAVNMGLLSTLLALRHGDPVARTWAKNFLYTAPMFLPTSAAASIMYFALQYHFIIMVIIGAPVLAAIYLGHRQHRMSVQQRIEAMEKAHRETIEALAVAINAKDEVTHEHVQRVQIYAAGVARLLDCSASQIEALKAGALLHDIGKIAVPDHILYKPTKLTSSEFDVMKVHTMVGAQILGRVEFPYPVVPIVRSHHERWDGKGYPDGLKGEEIPLTARILSVVDCFDAVREDRQYRKGMTRAEAINLVMEGSGTQYDPRVVGVFITNLPAFEAEIQATRHEPLPTFGIEPTEKLSAVALRVPPAAGLLSESDVTQASVAANASDFSHQHLKSLYVLSQELNEAPSQREAIESFTKNLRSVVPFETCAVTLITPKKGKVIVVHATGRHEQLLRGRLIPLDTGVTGWVIANRRPLCNTNPGLDLPREYAAEFHDYRTLAVYPIRRGEAVSYGAVSLYSTTLAEYSAEHQMLLGEAIGLLATALSAHREGVKQERFWEHPPEDDSPAKLPDFQTPRIESDETTLKSDLEH